MADTLGKLAIEIVADVDQLKTGFDKTRKMAEKAGQDSAKAFEQGNKAQAKQMKEVEAAASRLISKYDKVKLAYVNQQKSLEDLNKVYKQGWINQKQYNDYQKKINREFDIGTSLAKKQSGAFAGLIGKLKVMGPLLAAAAAAGFVAMAKSQLENAEAISKSSKAIGISAVEYQQFAYMGDEVGLSADQMSTALRTLAQTAGKAALGAKTQSELFAALGIELNDAAGNAKTAADLFPEVADALAQIESPAKRAQIELMLFGSAGAQLDGLLAGGSEKLDDLKDSFQALGLQISNTDIEKLAEANKKFDDMQKVLGVKVAKTVADNADAIMILADAFGFAADRLGSLVKTMERYIKIASQLSGGDFANWITGNWGAIGGGASNGIDSADTTKRLGFNSAPEGWDKGFGGKPKAVNQSGLNSLLAPKGRTGRSGGGDRARMRGLRDDKAFADAIASLQTEFLRAMKTQVTDIKERADIERKLVQIDKERFLRTLELEGPKGSKRFTGGEVDQQKTLYEKNRLQKLEIIAEEEKQQLLDENLQVQGMMNDRAIERLDMESAASRTMADARRIELEILGIKQQERRAGIERDLLDSDISDAKKDQLRIQLDNLQDIEELEGARVIQGTMNALEAYSDSLLQTAQEIKEAQFAVQAAFLDNINVRTANFADNFANSLGNAAGAIAQFQSPLKVLTGLLQDLANQFTQEFITKPITDLARREVTGPAAEKLIGGNAGVNGLTIEQENAARAKAVASLTLFNGAIDRAAAHLAAMSVGGGGGGGLLSMISGLSSSFSPSAGLNAASNSLINANPGIFAKGGMIFGNGTGQSDSVDATGPRGRYKLSTGEFITNAAATSSFRPLLESINAGKIPSMGALFAPMMNQSAGTNINVPVTVNGGSSDPRENRKIGRQIGAEASRVINEARGYNR